jgi:hypothetical protein
MSEKLPLLYHHGEMLGFIKCVRSDPSSYVGDKYAGMNDLTDLEAVEIYMSEVIDKDSYYRTGSPEIREQYKNGILQAVLAEKNGIEIEYVSDSTPSGDVICHGCYQFGMEKPDSPGCVRRERTA